LPCATARSTCRDARTSSRDIFFAQDIAATLNRMGMPTGQSKTWTAHRVGSLRRVRGIHAYRSAEKTGEWLTVTEAATKLGVSSHRIRRLIAEKLLAAEQVVPGAPYQIRASDLQDNRIIAAIARSARPCRSDPEKQLAIFPVT
jgi:excisionase family DNA binding protein